MNVMSKDIRHNWITNFHNGKDYFIVLLPRWDCNSSRGNNSSSGSNNINSSNRNNIKSNSNSNSNSSDPDLFISQVSRAIIAAEKQRHQMVWMSNCFPQSVLGPNHRSLKEIFCPETESLQLWTSGSGMSELFQEMLKELGGPNQIDIDWIEISIRWTIVIWEISNSWCWWYGQ